MSAAGSPAFQRLGKSAIGLLLLAVLVWTEISTGQRAPTAAPAAPATQSSTFFQKYCFECHSGEKPEASLGLDTLLKDPNSIGTQSMIWGRIADQLQSGKMPAADAKAFPTDAEREGAVHWVRASVAAYEQKHAGEPGRVTMRRLTSGEYAYAIEDLTGVRIAVPIDATSDTVGAEGFSNFGDVQFIQDANLERYLEAAKIVADHAMIGSGPLAFYSDTGRTGLELSALARIDELYDNNGFRVVSGEGGRPFGLERYGSAFYAAWYYQHRVALGNPTATLQSLAAKEGIPGRFAEHVWDVVNKPIFSYPMIEMIERFKALPAPTADIQDSIAKGREGATALQGYLTTWPSWFFSRGDLAAGGQGDESPLAFNDLTLAVAQTKDYAYQLGARGGGGRGRGGGGGGAGGGGGGGAAAGGSKVFILFTNLNPAPGVKPVVIFRNAQVVTRSGGGGGGGFARGNPTTTPGDVAAGATTQTAGARGRRGGGGGLAQGNPTTTPGDAATDATAQAQARGGRRGGGRGLARGNPTTAPGDAATDATAQAQARGGRRGRGGGAGGAILSTQPLKDVLPPEVAALLNFGVSPDGSTLGPNDFAITGPVSLELAPSAGVTMELQAQAEIGADRNAAVRLTLSDRAEGSARDANRVLLAEPGSAGQKAFRAGIVEYLSMLPPNSNGEANPADKDPVPLPFDSTYNTPEHDAFVLKVKYQRNDQFLTDNMLEPADRTRLNIAWNDLTGSFPYHDAYLQMLAAHYDVKPADMKMADLTPEKIAAFPDEMRTYVMPLLSEYVQVLRAFKEAEPGHIDNAIAFASRAWRRPLSDEEKASLRAFYQKSRTTNKLDHEAATRALIARVLMSPAFLYRVETVASNTETPLNGWEMASRLSFFLWASIPDEELRRAAGAGELDKPEMLATQVKRMIADPKARRIATEFFGQWLGFYHFDEYRGIDTSKFPEFTEAVQSAMYDEAVSTFEYLVRQNRPVKEVLDADYTFLNQPLARFYGVDGQVEVTSQKTVVKVDGAKAINRGGALQLGSVLTVTSAPLRTSPVKRGDWVLRRILGTPTPPPPADAGTLPNDPAAFGGLTLRERLNQHKHNPTCANCHLSIDPLGFPLENFDNIGRVRTVYTDGKPVDVTGEFADGTTLNGAADLIGYLGKKDSLFMRNLSRKMLGYALGRGVTASDQRLIDEMAAAGNGSSFADLAVQVVTSRQFRNHEGRAASPTTNPASPIRAAAMASPLSSQPGATQ